MYCFVHACSLSFANAREMKWMIKVHTRWVAAVQNSSLTALFSSGRVRILFLASALTSPRKVVSSEVPRRAPYHSSHCSSILVSREVRYCSLSISTVGAAGCSAMAAAEACSSSPGPRPIAFRAGVRVEVAQCVAVPQEWIRRDWEKAATIPKSKARKALRTNGVILMIARQGSVGYTRPRCWKVPDALAAMAGNRSNNFCVVMSEEGKVRLTRSTQPST